MHVSIYLSVSLYKYEVQMGKKYSQDKTFSTFAYDEWEKIGMVFLCSF